MTTILMVNIIMLKLKLMRVKPKKPIFMIPC